MNSNQAAQVRRQVVRCRRCHLGSLPGVRPVPYRAPQDSTGPRMAIVGEAPGREENTYGKPFVGPSGQILNTILREAGLNLDMFFICNTVSCWPGGPPPEESVRACRVNLKAQLNLYRPHYVLLLGNYALRSAKPGASIGQVRGKPFRLKSDRWYLATYHPAYALRNASGRIALTRDIERFAGLILGGD